MAMVVHLHGSGSLMQWTIDQVPHDLKPLPHSIGHDGNTTTTMDDDDDDDGSVD